METYTLNAKAREATGNQVGALRREGFVPAVVYGAGDNMNVSIELRELKKLYDKVGESAIIDLNIEGGKSAKVLIQAVQYHPLKHEIIHVDLRQINMDEKIEAHVELELVGESPAVKAHGAVMIRNLDLVTVSCLPTDLVQSIEVDLSKLDEIGSSITVGDLTAPQGIEILTPAEEPIVIANAPRTATAAEEEEEAAANEKAAGEKSAEEKKAE